MGNPNSRTALPSALLTLPLTAGFAAHLINPLAALEEQRNLDLVVLPLRPAIAVRLAILLPPDGQRSRLVAAFTDHVKRVIDADLQHIRPFRH